MISVLNRCILLVAHLAYLTRVHILTQNWVASAYHGERQSTLAFFGLAILKKLNGCELFYVQAKFYRMMAHGQNFLNFNSAKWIIKVSCRLPGAMKWKIMLGAQLIGR